MPKYMFLLLISLTCMASEPKFRYMDCVRIKEGFYKDCRGKVINYYPANGNNSKVPMYEVSVDDCKGGSLIADFFEDELKGCKK